MDKPVKDRRQTYDIPEAGGMAGLARSASYRAARDGYIPTIDLGKRKVVPKELWDRRLRGESAAS
jgi:hypothetical protein